MEQFKLCKYVGSSLITKSSAFAKNDEVDVQQITEVEPTCIFENGSLKVTGTADHITMCINGYFWSNRRQDHHAICRFSITRVLWAFIIVIGAVYGWEIGILKEMLMVLFM